MATEPILEIKIFKSTFSGDGDSCNSCYLKKKKNGNLIYIGFVSEVCMFSGLHKFFGKRQTCKRNVKFFTETIFKKVAIITEKI